MKKSNKNLVTGYSLLSTRILGIDPGYGRVGIAVVEKTNQKESLLHSECFETDPKLPHPDRLALIVKKINDLIKKFSPGKMAIESLLWSKNVKTAMGVAEARGAILAEVAKHKIAIFEYNPNSIKLAVTGYGKADKKQVETMLCRLLGIKKNIKYDDEYDAIAVALTCASSSYPQQTQ